MSKRFELVASRQTQTTQNRLILFGSTHKTFNARCIFLEFLCECEVDNDKL